MRIQEHRQDALSQEEFGLDELAAPAPDENPNERGTFHEDTMRIQEHRQDALSQEEFGLDELAAPAPDDNPDERGTFHHESLETHGHGEEFGPNQDGQERRHFRMISTWLIQAYVVSYLIFFSIFGVLARLGLQALTVYPGAPVANADLWANVGGSLLMGMLREDRMLFRRHWRQELENAHRGTNNSADEVVEKNVEDSTLQSYAAAKGALPAYIGLTVGFCGSFTSFASVCRDAFLAIANELNTTAISTSYTTPMPRLRPAGDSFMAVLAVLVLEVGLSIVALTCGAHIAIGLARPAQKIPVWNLSRFMDPMFILLGPGCWLGSVMLTIWPVYNAWRGQALFAIVFAPVGCLLRFQLSVHLNRLTRSFPIGTFAANILGTCILGMAYDLQMSSTGATVVGCQVLQGIMDGFCGALTTVSTWVLELDTLRLRHAYFYGSCSIVVGVGFITAIMGSLNWTRGFSAPTCDA